MAKNDQKKGFLTGQLLIAMPQMPDPRFARTVIYICAHSDDGAMGLVINRLFEELSFQELLEQVGLQGAEFTNEVPVHSGGPVESARGFVLHSAEFVHDETMVVDEGVALTASVDILRAIAHGEGPRQSLLALGYSGWGPGQLENEIHGNGWLNAPADDDLLYGEPLETKWKRSIAKIGIDFSMLSGESGRA
ncbi:MAG: YqgE/AlgH family protein [Alphaproteobacteria bacterium]|nr:YqgE/AlgH family protein [Alphaproteobacteria bacterium]